MTAHAIRLLSFGAFASAALLAAAPIQAAQTIEWSTKVSYRDLDLTRDADVAVLKTRIAQAATAHCGPVDPRDLQALDRANACRKLAVEDASARLQPVIASLRGTSIYAMNDTAVPATH